MTNNEILAYKSFDKDFKCRGYQYSVGEWFKHDGAVEVGASGFHAYINPLDLLGYCLLLDNKFAVVKCSGDVRFEEGGDSSVAVSTGIDSKSKAGIGGAIVCVYRDSEDGSIIHIKASKVGENGIKPDTWYTLNANGDFTEVK